MTPITVKDLIKKLSEFDENRQVWSCSDSGRVSEVVDAQEEVWTEEVVVVLF